MAKRSKEKGRLAPAPAPAPQAIAVAFSPRYVDNAMRCKGNGKAARGGCRGREVGDGLTSCG